MGECNVPWPIFSFFFFLKGYIIDKYLRSTSSYHKVVSLNRHGAWLWRCRLPICSSICRLTSEAPVITERNMERNISLPRKTCSHGFNPGLDASCREYRTCCDRCRVPGGGCFGSWLPRPLYQIAPIRWDELPLWLWWQRRTQIKHTI